MQNNDVIGACQALEKAGKKPTIALVKTKLAGKVPLALIVRGIQRFNSSQIQGKIGNNEHEIEQKIDSIETAQKDKCICTERLTLLEKKMSTMSADIISLQAQVKALTAQ